LFSLLSHISLVPFLCFVHGGKKGLGLLCCVGDGVSLPCVAELEMDDGWRRN
jgi:hypothetical protein